MSKAAVKVKRTNKCAVIIRARGSNLISITSGCGSQFYSAVWRSVCRAR